MVVLIDSAYKKSIDLAGKTVIYHLIYIYNVL